MIDPGTVPPPLDRRKAVGCVAIAAIVLATFLVLVVAALLAWKSAQTRRVATALAEIRGRGEPADTIELQAWCSLPAGTADLSPLYISALRDLESASGAQHLPFLGTADDPSPPGQPWPELTAAEQLLADHADALRRLQQAATQAGGVRFELDLAQGFETTLEHVQLLRNAARVLQLQAHVRAHRGDARGVADSIQTLQRLVETMGHEPTLVSQLVRVAVCGITVDLCGTMLSRVEFSDEDLERLAAGFESMRLADGLHRALVGERVMGILAFRDPGTWADMDLVAPPLARLNRDADLAIYLELMGQAIAIAQQPLPQVRRDMQAWRPTVAQAMGDQAVGRVRYPLSSHLLPALEAAADAIIRGDGYNRVAVTALKIELHRRRHGRLPDRLEDLVPELLAEVPIDPFTEQPLRYVVRDGGYRVYSVGQDGRDHGGQPMNGDAPYNESDLVIRVPEK